LGNIIKEVGAISKILRSREKKEGGSVYRKNPHSGRDVKARGCTKDNSLST